MKHYLQIDEIVIFIQNEHDIHIIGNLIDAFEKATNAKINKRKTKFLTHGKWEGMTSWPLPWIKASSHAMILGNDFYRNVKDTMASNQNRLLDDVRKSLACSYERNLTLNQKVNYFNLYTLPIVEFVAKVIPIDLETSNKIQKLATKLIWAGCHEKLASPQCIAPLKEGGL